MFLECPGPYEVFTSKYGKVTKDCSACNLPHDGIDQSWKFIQRWLPVSPEWDGREQTPEKIHKYSVIVRERFDEQDIEWATKKIEENT